MIITGRTRVVGVIGDPVGHSLSPVMHNTEFVRLGLDYVYVPWRVAAADLAAAVAGFRAQHVAGFNITIPHKQAVIPLLDEVDDQAILVGAVNTVLHGADGHLKGFNTDVRGWTGDIERDVALRGKTVAVLGAGGAARAICTGACEAGAAELRLINRTPERARALAEAVAGRYPGVTVRHVGLSDPDARSLLRASGVIVNTTPVGMSGDPGIPIPAEWLHREQYVYDTIYTPSRTPLLRAAEAAGCVCRNGLGMLARQGALAFEIWTGHKPDAAAMEETLKRLLHE